VTAHLATCDGISPAAILSIEFSTTHEGDSLQLEGETTMYGFKAFVFNGKRTAGKALETLEDHTPVYPWVEDAAVVSRSKLGFTRIHSTWAQDDSAVGAGTGLGAVTGGMLGMLLGPGGALAGAAVGGSMGALIGATDEIVFDDPRLDDFAASLAKDTSALVLVGEAVTLADFTSAVRPFGGKVIETNLDDKDIKALKKALGKKARRPAPVA
jgi:uncharacterized membrane protein